MEEGPGRSLEPLPLLVEAAVEMFGAYYGYLYLRKGQTVRQAAVYVEGGGRTPTLPETLRLTKWFTTFPPAWTRSRLPWQRWQKRKGWRPG